MNKARKATAFDLMYLRIVVMRRVSFLGQPSGEEPGPRVPELPNAGCLLDAELCFVESLLDDDELGAVVVVGASASGGELWTEDVSGEETAEFTDDVELAAESLRRWRSMTRRAA